MFYNILAQEKPHFTFLEFTPFELKPEFGLQINNAGQKAAHRNCCKTQKYALHCCFAAFLSILVSYKGPNILNLDRVRSFLNMGGGVGEGMSWDHLLLP